MVLDQLNKQIAASRETSEKDQGGLDVSDDLDLRRRFGRWRVAVGRRANLCENVQRHGAELPGMTQFVVNMSDGMVVYGPYVVVGLIVAIFAIRKYGRGRSGRACS